MCPACLLSAALVAGGATTAGGATALFVRGVWARKRKLRPKPLQRRGGRRDDGASESRGE
ncbi:MAG: hypothetical protein WDZ66_06120 [Steroidobacteraceae bacterium]